VFLLLIILLRLLWSLVARTFSMITSMSLANRFLGGILQLCLSAMWMALIVGILYPFVGLGVFKPVGEMLATSRLVAVLIGIYKAMLPPALARIVPRM